MVKCRECGGGHEVQEERLARPGLGSVSMFRAGPGTVGLVSFNFFFFFF